MKLALALVAALFATGAPALAAVNEVPCDPTAYAATALWLDGADTAQVTTSGGLVTSWGDKSGQGNTVTNPTTADQPGVSTLNGLQDLTFNGSTQNLTKSSNTALPSGSSAFSIYIVAGVTNGNSGTNQYSLSYGNGSTRNGFYYGSNSGWGYDIGGGYFDNPTTAAPTTTVHLITGIFPGGTFSGYQQWIDGNAQPMTVNFSNTPSSPAGAPMFVGSTESSNDYLGGVIAEELVHVGADSAMTEQQTEGCIAWKWRLQAALPPTHPFARKAPWVAIGNDATPFGTVGNGRGATNVGSGR